jgi:hypothetical protein
MNTGPSTVFASRVHGFRARGRSLSSGGHKARPGARDWNDRLFANFLKRESRDPFRRWIPAFAGMTRTEQPWRQPRRTYRRTASTSNSDDRLKSRDPFSVTSASLGFGS